MWLLENLKSCMWPKLYFCWTALVEHVGNSPEQARPDGNLPAPHPAETSLGWMLSHVAKEGLSCPAQMVDPPTRQEHKTSPPVIWKRPPSGLCQQGLPHVQESDGPAFHICDAPLQTMPTCLLGKVELRQPGPHLPQCLDRAGFRRSQVEHLTFFGNVTSSNS